MALGIVNTAYMLHALCLQQDQSTSVPDYGWLLIEKKHYIANVLLDKRPWVEFFKFSHLI